LVLVDGAGSHYSSVGFFEGGSTYREDGIEVEWPEGSYSTELYTDHLIEYIDANKDDGHPFFAFAAYTSPHWPLQVPDAYLDLYSGHYDDGYDRLREQRLSSLKSAGIIPEESELPPRNDAITKWDDLSEEEQRNESRKMELYAAMVHNLDFHVGRLVGYLTSVGLIENTLIVFMSDNGAAPEDFYETLEYVRQHYDNTYEDMGKPSSWVSYGPQWAEASSAPFSRYKRYTREGGIVAPLIVAGKGVARAGAINRSYLTVMDLAPTFLEAAGVMYPSDESVWPMSGESVTGVLEGKTDKVHDDEYVTALYHGGRAFIRQGKWKLVNLEPPFRESDFELFDVEADPGETTNLAVVEADVYADMIALWRTTRIELGIVLPGDL
jgi:arylsulfatase